MGSPKMLFLNIAWMERYEGLAGDVIKGGGSHVNEQGWGGEMMNFKPHRGYMYGSVQPNRFETIDVEHLGAPTGAAALEDVLVVWVAPRDGVGNVVVGWYDKATVFRRPQRPVDVTRRHRGIPLRYHVKARSGDCVRLPVDVRTLIVPRAKSAGPGMGMGQANVWYADNAVVLKRRVLDFIRRYKSGGKLPKTSGGKKPGGRGGRWQPDPFRRQKVEKAAIACTTACFERLGYDVDSVEKDRVGWDLEATSGEVKLLFEVKGLSEEEAVADLTPNEYQKSKDFLQDYRICMVTRALTKPKLLVFRHSMEADAWVSDQGQRLDLEEIVAARVAACGMED